MGTVYFLLLLAQTHTVRDDRVVLRTACGSGEPAVAEVHRGDPVVIRFAYNGDAGPCFKVSVTREGKTVEGYLPAAVVVADDFENARRQAPSLDRPSSPAGPPAASPTPAPRLNADPAPEAYRLIENGQPEAALALLEPRLKVNRRDAGILSLAGLAAYRADNLRRAIEYWKESLEMSPSTPVERLLRQAERELAAGQGSERLYGARFLLRFDPAEVNAEQARAILPMLDSEFARVAEHLGCRAEERIAVIVQSRESYLRTSGAAEWSGGRYDGRIHVAVSQEDPRRALVHEIVHACLARTGAWPAWLHEGLAQKLSGETIPQPRRSEVLKLARAGSVPGLGKLGQTWSRMSAQHAALAYSMALVAAEIFYDVHGAWGVRNLIQNPSSLDRITADLDRRLRE